jgi:hypothetical protein
MWRGAFVPSDVLKFFSTYVQVNSFSLLPHPGPTEQPRLPMTEQMLRTNAEVRL